MATLLAITVGILLGGLFGYALGRVKSLVKEAEVRTLGDPVLRTRLRLKGIMKRG